MTFNDIFQSSFLESVSEFSLLDTAIGLTSALIMGLFIFVIYQKTLTGVMYSTGFALTLVGLSLVTTLVIMAVTSNVVLSLGMVGALSIVRFRAAIKEPVEIVFLFWSLAVGIVIGAGMIPLAVSLAPPSLASSCFCLPTARCTATPISSFSTARTRTRKPLCLTCWARRHSTIVSKARQSRHLALSSPQSCAPRTLPPALSISSPVCPGWKTPRWSATTGNTCPDGAKRWQHRNIQRN